MTDLILVLGDQLTPDLSSLRRADPDGARVVMAELREEAGYVPHHKKKIALIFSAMRHFRDELRERGWTVDYHAYDDSPAFDSFDEVVAHHLNRHDYDRLIVTEPGEWRLRQAFEAWSDRFGLEVIVLEDDRFLCSHAQFEDWAGERKSLRMEHFYRDMRRRTGLLMEGDKPAGGQWNYDKDNREAAPPELAPPRRYTARPDAITDAVLDLVEAEFESNFGTLRPFGHGVTRTEAHRALDHFITDCLPDFGRYQDAMLGGQPFMFHALISAYLNIGLLDPLHVCRRAESAWKDGKAPLNSVEGFIRQIIGWREFVRGIYWREGADYVRSNQLNAQRALPDFYWSGETGMACLADAIGQTREHAYAHHIQRLMVTGTFALIAGIEPRQVHEWYLAVYVDAFEWVEAPNTIGMSQFADGGLLASKPYAASGAYINRMSDYCGSCRYAVSDKTGDRSCPFNSLYWDFLDRNRDRLDGNGRLGQPYATWDRMSEDKKRAYRERAADVLSDLDAL
ncbi:cryptochrome/photolyase family protein [Maricaulis sp. CAU 1757]